MSEWFYFGAFVLAFKGAFTPNVTRHTCECNQNWMKKRCCQKGRLFPTPNDVTMVIALLLIRETCLLKWHNILAINWPYVIHGTCRLMCLTYTYTHEHVQIDPEGKQHRQDSLRLTKFSLDVVDVSPVKSNTKFHFLILHFSHAVVLHVSPQWLHHYELIMWPYDQN